jgi:hypothetical protein
VFLMGKNPEKEEKSPALLMMLLRFLIPKVKVNKWK